MPAFNPLGYARRAMKGGQLAKRRIMERVSGVTGGRAEIMRFAGRLAGADVGTVAKRGALYGGVYGGASGLLSDEGSLIGGALQGAILGAGLGIGAKVGASMYGRMLPRVGKRGIPTRNDPAAYANWLRTKGSATQLANRGIGLGNTNRIGPSMSSGMSGFGYGERGRVTGVLTGTRRPMADIFSGGSLVQGIGYMGTGMAPTVGASIQMGAGGVAFRRQNILRRPSVAQQIGALSRIH